MFQPSYQCLVLYNVILFSVSVLLDIQWIPIKLKIYEGTQMNNYCKWSLVVNQSKCYLTPLYTKTPSDI